MTSSPSVRRLERQQARQTCSSAAALAGAYQKVINAYGLKAIDIDIEGTDVQQRHGPQRTVDALKTVKANNPGLKTVITFGTDHERPRLHRRLINRAAASGLTVDVWMHHAVRLRRRAARTWATLTTQAAEGLKNTVKTRVRLQRRPRPTGTSGISSMNGITDDTGETRHGRRLQDHARLRPAAPPRAPDLLVGQPRPACGAGTDGDTCSGVSQQPYDYLKVFTQYTG